MEDDKGVTGSGSTSDSSTGNDSTGSSSGSSGAGSSTGADDSKEAERRIEALKQEEARLLKSISDRRAERRALDTDPSKTTSGGTDTSTRSNDSSGADPVADAAKKRAFRVFVQKHPEYADDAKWRELQQAYVSRRGNLLWEDVVEDLDDAHFVLNRDAIQTEAAKKAQTAIAQKLSEADRADLGGTTSQSDGGVKKVELSPDEKKALAKLQKADPAMTEEKYLKAKKRLTE